MSQDQLYLDKFIEKKYCIMQNISLLKTSCLLNVVAKKTIYNRPSDNPNGPFLSCKPKGLTKI
jgi:hypothetical protein